MKIEKLDENKSKKRVIGAVAVISILSIGIFAASMAKYRSTKSISIAKGTIKYNKLDLHLAEVYVANDERGYSLATEIPSSGYEINTDASKTRCEVDGAKVDVEVSYQDGELVFSKLTDSGTKCYVYLDKKANAADKIPEGNATDDSMFEGIEGNGVYTWTKGDYSGGTQPIKYYRGNVNNNWVVFGKDGANYIWWRIIRNNSNGSIRMIYAGTSASKTKAPTDKSKMMISGRVFNFSRDKNYYVGLKYSIDSMHGTTTNASILGEITSTDRTTLYGWYNETLAKSIDYSGKLDLNAGFCSDRNHSISESGPAIADAVSAGSTEKIYYGSYIRLKTNSSPSLLCANTRDKFTDIPVGLITADEVSMAGMVYGPRVANTNSWVYIGQTYWTMSPNMSYSTGLFPALEFDVYDGYLYDAPMDSDGIGVRPVINLKADTIFVSGNGEATTPFVVQGT